VISLGVKSSAKLGLIDRVAMTILSRATYGGIVGQSGSAPHYFDGFKFKAFAVGI
jgi:hypothetical protein